MKTCFSLLCALLALTAGSLAPARAETPPPYVTSWGSLGSAPGQFNQPAGIAIHNGLVYVADQMNDRIQVFTTGGAFVRQWVTGSQDNPTGIAVGPLGTIYVTMHHTQMVKMYTPTGAPMGFLGGWGPGPGQFMYPVGIATDAGGNFYVADRDNNRIQKFTEYGQYLGEWGGVVSPVGIAISPAGLVHVTDASPTPVSVFTLDGGLIGSWGTQGPAEGQLVAADGITFDTAGNLFVADGGSGSRVVKFTGAGNYLTQWGGFGNGIGQFQYPGDVAVDDNGFVYVTDWLNHRVQVFGASATPANAKSWGHWKAEYR